METMLERVAKAIAQKARIDDQWEITNIEDVARAAIEAMHDAALNPTSSPSDTNQQPSP